KRVPRALVPAMVGPLLAACFGGGAPSSSAPAPEQSGTSSVVASSTPAPAAPVLPPEASVGTRAGAGAFFRYFWAVYNYSYIAKSADDLRQASAGQCGFCGQAIREIEKGRLLGYQFIGADVSVLAAVAAPGDVGRGLIVNALARQSPGRTV